ncbi:MAG: hypothetical protein QNK89_11495 [Lacinutrix sp.]|uniref:hypothetical protein n=1 Tax=Lacinutrix sp. TaxID=1937692 RepID=UPI0030A00642
MVSVDGVSTLEFDQPITNYSVSINHRNHLGVITNNTFSLNGTPSVINFTDANNQITYGINAQTAFGMLVF